MQNEPQNQSANDAKRADLPDPLPNTPSPPPLIDSVDPELSASCTGISLKFRHLWEIAQRYVRRGDDYHRRAGMKLIAEFANQMPLDDAAELIESHFDRSGYHPSFGGRPSLDTESFRAAVAIGLADDYLPRPPERARERRGRMAAVLARSLLVTTAQDERPVVQAAFDALLSGDSNWYANVPQPNSGLIRGVRFDQEIVERCSEAVDEGRWDDAIRSAMIVLENRIRASTGEALDVVGEKLVTKAFAISSDLNFAPVPAEKEGLLNLFRSAFLLFRNPAAHRFGEHGEGRALHVLMLVDLLLSLTAEANTRLYKPDQYLAPHEAVKDLRVERVLHVDLDSDGNNERILIYSGISQTRTRVLRLLVLKQQGESWRRVRFVGQFEVKGRLRSIDSLKRSVAVSNSCDTTQEWVVLYIDCDYETGILLVMTWRDNAVRIIPIESASLIAGIGEGELQFKYANGLPEFKDADGDGEIELYVPGERSFYADDRIDIVRFTTVYNYYKDLSKFVIVGHLAFPGQSLRTDEAREFVRSLDEAEVQF